MGRSFSRARIRAPCFRARTRALCFRARTRATQRENKWSAAGGARGQARTCSARTALCDARVIPYAARTTLLWRARDLSGAGDSGEGDLAPRNPTYPT